MIKVAINGFGRIGRPVFRRLLDKHPNIEIKAINDLADTRTLAYLLQHDSVYGRYGRAIKYTDKSLSVDGREFQFLSEKEPLNLPWQDMGVDIVLECTGHFTTLEGASQHLKAGAKKVIISAPCKSPGLPHFVLGVNEEKYDAGKEHVMSMGSCTTNALAPIAKVIHQNFGIDYGLMTTIHSYTSSQRLVDLPHKDLRRGRAAAVSFMPTTTGAAIAVTKTLPELEGKIDGIAVRVPTPAVSLVDFVAKVKKKVTVEDVNNAFQKAAQQDNLRGILTTEEQPLVSIDFKGNSHSAIVDTLSTMVQEDNLVKVLAWYDNEWGYSCRLAEFCEYVGAKL